MAWAFVNGGALSETDWLTTIALPAQSLTAGNTNIVAVSNFASRTVLSVTDTAGNTYTKRGSTISGDASHGLEIWTVDNCLGHASNVVTATYNDVASYRTLQSGQYSGLLSSGSFDASSAGTLPSSSTTQVASSVATTASDDLVIGLFLAWGSARTLSSSGTSTLRVVDATPADVAWVDRNAATAGSYSTQVALNTAEQYFGASIAFKQAGGGGGGSSNGAAAHHYSQLRGHR